MKYNRANIDGCSIFYREAGNADAPALLLLHGFPTSSHMFRDLMPRLADRYHVVAIVTSYDEWLTTSHVPKLFLKGEPGGILSAGRDIDFARSLPAQTEVTVAGVHYVQEDSPHEIGRAIAAWMGVSADKSQSKHACS